MYIDYARKGSTWVQILNVPMPKEKTNWMEKWKMKKEKKRKKIKYEPVVQWCGGVGCDAMWGT